MIPALAAGYVRGSAFLFLLGAATVFAATTNAPVSPTAESHFIIKKGFRIDRVTDERIVEFPGAMAFDENGRLFVAEMRDYPDARNQTPHLGRIRLLEDTNHDGIFETSTVFADDLPLPSALICANGGVFVGAAPDILFLQDTNHDGVADLRRVVLTGFGISDRPSPRPLINSFAWGLDNRIHVASGGLDGAIKIPSAGGQGVVLHQNDFSFDPNSFSVALETGPAESGLTFDSRGREFITDFAHPLRMPLYGALNMERDPWFPKPPAVVDVVDPATPLLQVNSAVLAAAALAGRGAPTSNLLERTEFSMAEGAVIFRGSALPAGYYDNALIPDASARVVHREVLLDRGVGAVGAPTIDETNGEFLMARDAWLHPVQVVNGPDGALYLAVMNFDATPTPAGSAATNADTATGIYRIASDNSPPKRMPQLGGATSAELVAELGSADAWVNETAVRLLIERRDRRVVPSLSQTIKLSRIPIARMSALRVLDGLGVVAPGDVDAGLRDSDDRVREQAVRLLTHLGPEANAAASLWLDVERLAGDPSRHVRYQLAFELGNINIADRATLLATIAECDPGDPWVRVAVFSSASEEKGALLVALAGSADFRASVGGGITLRQLAEAIGMEGRTEDALAVVNLVVAGNLDAGSNFALLAALDEGLHRTRNSLALLVKDHRLDRVYAAAMDAAMNSRAADSVRVAALQLLGRNIYTYGQSADLLLLLLRPGESVAVQSAVIHALCEQVDPAVLASVGRRWPALSPVLRQDAIAALLSRVERQGPVLSALENGSFSAADFAPLQVNLLRTSTDTAIQQRAARIFGAFNPSVRAPLVEQFLAQSPTNTVPGRGRDIFLARCAACHVARNDGSSFGPNLADVKGTRETLAADILDPNRSITPGYDTHVLLTTEGEMLVGRIADSNGSAITFEPPYGETMVLPRQYIASDDVRNWSLMPEGIVDGLSAQDVADLIGYLWPAAK